MDLVFSETILPLFSKDASNLDLYTKPYNVDVSNKESLLPVATIQFSDSANGVRHIFPTDDRDVIFVPRKIGQSSVFKLLEVGSDPSIGYEVFPDKVVFSDNIPAEIKSVKMYVVTMPSSLDPDDEFILPVGFSQQAMIAGFLGKVEELDKSAE